MNRNLPFPVTAPGKNGLCLLSIFALFFVVWSASAQVSYVTPTGGTTTQDGTSWATAYAGTSLQTLLATSPTGTTVLVGQGTYKPTATTDRTQSFTIASGVQVYGGYDPGTGNRTTNPSSTTLSGDIDNNNTLDNGNSYHVVRFYSASSQTRLDGVVITGGRANGTDSDNWGGGILNLELGGQPTAPTIASCTFMLNSAGAHGGAMYNQGVQPGSNTVITDCHFESNTSDQRGGGIFNSRGADPNNPICIRQCTFLKNQALVGGAIYNHSEGGTNKPRIERCTFRLNTASVAGAGMYNNGIGGNCSPVIIACSFTKNQVTGYFSNRTGAAAIHNNGASGNASPVITNCSSIGNTSVGEGGTLFGDAQNGGTSILTLTNCSFSKNSGSSGNGVVYLDCGGTSNQVGQVHFTNCILYDNGENPISSFYGSYFSNHSLIDASTSAALTDPSNLTTATSPFVDADNENLQLVACSLPVNAGTNTATELTGITTDLAGNPRFVNTVDIGAYEFQGVTITGQPVSASTVCIGSAVSVPVSASGIGSLTFQWFRDGNSLGASQTTAALSLTHVQAGDGGSYQLVITSACNSLTTNAFSLSVNSGAAPSLSLNPSVSLPIWQNTANVTVNITGCPGGAATWKGSDASSGTGTVINVPTSAVASIIYSATCTGGICPSAPGTLTVSISSSAVTGSFDGFIYGADCSTFRGWAWDRNKPNTPVSVDILDGATVVATLLADVFRQDLLTAGKGNGKHAFSWSIPQSLKDGLAHSLSARVSGSGFILKDSPKSLVCQGSSSPANKAPVPPSPSILIAPLAAQVNVPFSSTLVAFTDPEGQPLTYALSGLPDGLSINTTSRVISGTPTVAGTFVLAYSASDGVLTNSVSFPLTVNPASTTTVTGNFEGFLDKVECGTIRGWVWDRNKPNTPLTVEFYHTLTKEVFGSTVANIYREDLKTAGKGNGAHAYSFTVPDGLKDGVQRPIMARVLGSTYDLKGGPKVLTCFAPAPARLSAETAEGLQVTVLGNPVSDQLQVEIRGAEGQPLQLKLTDASGRLVSQRQIDGAVALEQQTIFVGQQPAGLLLLRVNSGIKTMSLKILKQ
ncbi:putative Ig domain-containing protein [Larkinella rosea]|uniref:Ig-like domain-containing protein n=1 Tax=Larkinella rosea TaxID=2025312 RepID=A0A3P1BFU8_9BACT|nr:putative Ig domain-containing protein [Larkinella rosea]RRA99986.1 hypothetical protein EHT25_25520 [Larkinella rosea]